MSARAVRTMRSRTRVAIIGCRKLPVICIESWTCDANARLVIRFGYTVTLHRY